MRICNFGGVVNLARELRFYALLLMCIRIYTCVHIASGRSLAVYAMAGATTVQAAVEKEAKDFCHWVKLVDECSMKNSGKFKLAVRMQDECSFCGIFPVLPGWLVGMT